MAAIAFRRRRNSKFIPEDQKCPLCECELMFGRWQHIINCVKDYWLVEEAQQITGFEWLAQVAETLDPDLQLTYAVPNAGRRSVHLGVKMKRAGLRAGVPDTIAPFARRGYISFAAEYKTHSKTSKLSPNQIAWLDKLTAANHFTIVCKDWTEWRDALLWYIGVNENEPTSWLEQKKILLAPKVRKNKVQTGEEKGPPEIGNISQARISQMLKAGTARVNRGRSSSLRYRKQ